MNEQEFKFRTKKVALRIIQLVAALPQGKVAVTIGGQLLRGALPSERTIVPPAVGDPRRT